MATTGKGYGMFAGPDKEPPSLNGPKVSGRKPPAMHSHSILPKRRIAGKVAAKRGMNLKRAL